MNPPSKLQWSAVHTVFLDMDGTLLDLNFDNYFWLEHVPLRYAQQNALTTEEAKAVLEHRYRAVEGTMQWYCVDYWTEQLGLDVALLKREVDHLIAVHPRVLEFLEAVRASGRRTVLVTNAHMKSLTLKMERTPLAGHLDRIICAHDLGVPKEAPDFWHRLQEVEPYAAENTLLVDDSVAVLRAARRHGIGHIVAVSNPDSTRPAREITEFPAIGSFSEIMPIPPVQSGG
jgi:putative hydrolase of the HAD superfamily